MFGKVQGLGKQKKKHFNKYAIGYMPMMSLLEN
jgi:hypothetical protein